MTQETALRTLIADKNAEYHKTFGSVLDANKESCVVFENGDTEPIVDGIIRPVRRIRIVVEADYHPEVMDQYPSFRNVGIEAVKESLEKRDIWPWRRDWIKVTDVAVEEI